MSLGMGSGKSRLSQLAFFFCDYACNRLRKSKPRTFSAFGEERPILLFTDRCWENRHAGLGAVMVDTATGERRVFSG